MISPYYIYVCIHVSWISLTFNLTDPGKPVRQDALDDTLPVKGGSVVPGSPSLKTRVKRRSSSHGKQEAMLNPRKTVGTPWENGDITKKMVI
jgi:hypothetical protein